MQIFPLYEQTWRIEDDGVRCFLLAGRDKALLIDSGMQLHGLRRMAEERTGLPVELLNTHADPDHIGANAEFDWFYLHPAEAFSYYNLHRGRGIFRPVEEGDVLDLGGRPLEILALPGHTPGSIAVLDRDHRALFSGDPVQDGDIFLFGARRQLLAYRYSLEKLERQKHRFDTIYPSHGTVPVAPALIGALHTGVSRVLAGQIEGQPVRVLQTEVLRYDVGVAGLLCDLPEQKRRELYAEK